MKTGSWDKLPKFLYRSGMAISAKFTGEKPEEVYPKIEDYSEQFM